MIKSHRFLSIAIALLCSLLPLTAEAKKLNVVTATTDMAALAQEVGGDRISVESIAKGYQDPHFVEAKPSFLLKLRQADLLIVVGLQLEIGWLPPLITQSGNSRLQDFDRRLSEAEKKWDVDMKPYRGRKVVTYHNSLPNFAKHFGLDVVGFVEPRPGIPPTPSHTFDLTNMMKRDHVKVIMVEPYFDRKTPDSIARETGGVVVEYLPSVGGTKEVTTFFQLFDYDIALLMKAFQANQ